jgi:hypothetical protein
MFRARVTARAMRVIVVKKAHLECSKLLDIA